MPFISGIRKKKINRSLFQAEFVKRCNECKRAIDAKQSPDALACVSSFQQAGERAISVQLDRFVAGNRFVFGYSCVSSAEFQARVAHPARKVARI